MTFCVQVILLVERFERANLKRLVVYLVVNFSCRVKLTGPVIVTLMAQSVDVLNFQRNNYFFALF